MEQAPAELEYKKNAKLSWSQQMGTTVALLLQVGQRDLIDWVIEVSHRCSDDLPS